MLFRLGEKEILAFLIKFGALVTDMLDMPFKEAKKFCQNHLGEEYEEQRDYIQNVLLKLIASDKN